MYAFAQHPQIQAIDEPFYSAYLHRTHVDHPGKELVMKSQPASHNEVLEKLPVGDQTLFLKNMSHHLTGVEDWSFMLEWKNIILIRSPRAVITSLIKQLPQPTLRDTGFEQLYELFNYLKGSSQEPILIDSKDFLVNPEGMMIAICDQLNIPYTHEMLNWPAGPKPYDGVWAPYWYDRVHQSTGFEPYREKKDKVPAKLNDLHAECISYYDALKPFVIYPKTQKQ